MPQRLARSRLPCQVLRVEAGDRPLDGRAYYPQAALGLVLDSLDGDLTPAAVSVETEIKAFTG